MNPIKSTPNATLRRLLVLIRTNSAAAKLVVAITLSKVVARRALCQLTNLSRTEVGINGAYFLTKPFRVSWGLF